jgi:hypothetical protein
MRQLVRLQSHFSRDFELQKQFKKKIFFSLSDASRFGFEKKISTNFAK